MWTKILVEEAAKHEVFAAAVKQGAAHYRDKFTARKAKDYITAFNGVLYWYNDDVFNVALAMYVVPGGQEIKIANCLVKRVTKGVGDPKDCVKITMRKIREYMDEKGIRRAYALTPNSSFTTFQDAFHELADSIVWEHSKILEDGSDSHPNGVWRRTFDRDPLLKNQDELWTSSR